MRIQFIQKLIDRIRGKSSKEMPTDKNEQEISPLQIKFNLLEEKVNKFHIEDIFKTYSFLNDEYSKQMYLKVLQYRLTEQSGILPKPKYIDKTYSSQYLINNEQIQIWNLTLNYIDLNNWGYNVRLFLELGGLHMALYQYIYETNNVSIKVEKDDIVIDGGACYGDESIIFADMAGINGKVYAFEFLPENLNIIEKNLNCNPEIKNRVKVINNALWNTSNTNLYVKEDGPATRCSLLNNIEYTTVVKTKSIDDLVKEENLNKLDFIKLDIEGSELESLIGAEQTIKQFKPKLAISLYHDMEHFSSIPKYIKKIVPEYELYLNHHTEHLGETVLYAKVKK